MKIGIIAPVWISIPPKNFGLGAQEYLTYHLAEGLVKKGHRVTLFATGDSKTSAKLISVSQQEIIDMNSNDKRLRDMFELLNLSQAYKHIGDFDILHNHLLPYGLLFANLFSVPTIHTLHYRIYPERADYNIYEAYRNQYFISISQAQRFIAPDLNYISTIYNGTDTEFYRYKDKPQGNYLLYIGRMKRYKGIHTAMQVARKLKLPLKIAAPLPSLNQPDYDEVQDYWEYDIKPHLNENMEHIDMLGGADKVTLYQNAKALIFPVEREEPFAMTAIEAMSCGTPVIAYDGGAIPELVVDGKTGYLVNNENRKEEHTYVTKEEGLSGLIHATKSLYSLAEPEYLAMRKASTTHVGKYFTVSTMINHYEAIYKKLLNTNR